MDAQIVEGDLLDQDVEAIVNAYNRNVIPWWLLLPQGVSGAIKKKAGLAPFRELARHGPIPLGGAAATSAGRLPFRCIIHVAGIDLLWRASRASIAASVHSAMALAGRLDMASIAFPVIGAGSGGMHPGEAEAIMAEAFATIEGPSRATIVRFKRRRRA